MLLLSAKVQDLLAEGEKLRKGRSGEPFKGSTILFGAMVQDHPVSVRDHSRRHQFGEQELPGIFLVFELIAGGIWKTSERIRNLSSKNQRERERSIENAKR